MVTWNANFEINPEDSDNANQGANEIRALKVAIRERMDLEHNFQANTYPSHKPGLTSICFIGNTADIANLSPSANGAVAYDTTLKSLKVYNGSWTRYDSIASGTKMLFVQAGAPVGWTIDANNNDRLLRVNSANGANTGGTWTVPIEACTLTVDQIPSHTHNIKLYSGLGYPSNLVSTAIPSATLGGNQASDANGGGNSHNHVIANTWRPAYIDAIICTKD